MTNSCLAQWLKSKNPNAPAVKASEYRQVSSSRLRISLSYTAFSM
jgi:hypothetical protein